MKKSVTWLGIGILIMGGILIVMLYKGDSDDMVSNDNEDDTEFNIEEYRKKIKEKGQLISKEKVNQKFNPKKIINKNINNVQLQLEEISENGSKKFNLIVENITEDTQILHFGTSQRYDYEIYNRDNELVYHYSDGKSFLQVIEEIELKPEERLNYEITIPTLDPGEYTLVASLVAKHYGGQRQIIQFKVN